MATCCQDRPSKSVYNLYVIHESEDLFYCYPMERYLYFRPYTCPCPGASCKWQGSLEQVMPHLMQSHKSITTLQGMFYFSCVIFDLQVVLAKLICWFMTV